MVAVLSQFLIVAAPLMGQWTCQATDYKGVYASGYGSTRQEASAEALLACQGRSRGACTLLNCMQTSRAD